MIIRSSVAAERPGCESATANEVRPASAGAAAAGHAASSAQRIADSPRQLAQRRQIETLFGSAHSRPVSGGAARPPVQRVLDIASSDTGPYSVLKYRQFQMLFKRKSLGLTIPAWVWLKKLAASALRITYDTWQSAIAGHARYTELVEQLGQPQEIKRSELRYGKAPPAPLAMNDAHGLIGMADWIQQTHPIASTTYVSPGGSADFIATVMRMRGGDVVDVPLSDIKRDKVGKVRPQALEFLRTCFRGARLRSRVVIFDTLSTGSALILLKEMLVEAIHVPAERIVLVALNGPLTADAADLVRTGKINVVPNQSDHVSYAKSRLRDQAYKDSARTYPKNPVGDLDAEKARKPVAPVRGARDELMTIMLAMQEVADEDFIEKEETEDAEALDSEVGQEGSKDEEGDDEEEKGVEEVD
jgi:hypothetical protein